MKPLRTLIVFAVVFLLAGAARAQTAGDLVAQGAKQFEAGEYLAAVESFKRSYELDPQPKTLFAWAQAERKSGDCSTAVKLFKKYLEGSPPERSGKVARDIVAECEAALGPQTEPSSEPDVLRPAPAPTPVDAPVARKAPWYTDVVGDVLLGAGVAGLGVGVAFFLMSSSTENAAEDAATYGEYADKIDKAKGQRTIAIIGFAAGGALVTAAIIKYATRPARRETPQVGAWTTGDGGGVVVFGRF